MDVCNGVVDKFFRSRLHAKVLESSRAGSHGLGEGAKLREGGLRGGCRIVVCGHEEVTTSRLAKQLLGALVGFEPKSLGLRDGYGAVWKLWRKRFRAVLLEEGRIGGMRHLVV